MSSHEDLLKSYRVLLPCSQSNNNRWTATPLCSCWPTRTISYLFLFNIDLQQDGLQQELLLVAAATSMPSNQF